MKKYFILFVIFASALFVTMQINKGDQALREASQRSYAEDFKIVRYLERETYAHPKTYQAKELLLELEGSDNKTITLSMGSFLGKIGSIELMSEFFKVEDLEGKKITAKYYYYEGQKCLVSLTMDEKTLVYSSSQSSCWDMETSGGHLPLTSSLLGK